MNCDCIPSRKCRAGIEVRGGGGGVVKNRFDLTSWFLFRIH